MKVELIKIPSEITEASIKQYLADCSSVVRNTQPKDNNRLYDRLLKESFGHKASRMLEYVPCVLHAASIRRAMNQYFGFRVDDKYYTTARELLNWGWSLDTILPFIDFTNYKVVKVTAPYFLYGQASTHNQITSVSHSNRYTKANLGYWHPPEYKDYYFTEAYADRTEEECSKSWNDFVETTSLRDLEDFMKRELGVIRREVSARGADMLQNRVYTLGGFTNNPNAWEHFINQRMKDKHTQLEMRQLAVLINIELTTSANE
jgi:hypothetical protein